MSAESVHQEEGCDQKNRVHYTTRGSLQAKGHSAIVAGDAENPCQGVLQHKKALVQTDVDVTSVRERNLGLVDRH